MTPSDQRGARSSAGPGVARRHVHAGGGQAGAARVRLPGRTRRPGRISGRPHHEAPRRSAATPRGLIRAVDYLDTEDLVDLARQLLGEAVPLRDIDLLGAAAARPQASACGEDAYPDVWAKAVAAAIDRQEPPARRRQQPPLLALHRRVPRTQRHQRGRSHQRPGRCAGHHCRSQHPQRQRHRERAPVHAPAADLDGLGSRWSGPAEAGLYPAPRRLRDIA